MIRNFLNSAQSSKRLRCPRDSKDALVLQGCKKWPRLYLKGYCSEGPQAAKKNEILPPDYGIYKFSRKFEEVMCPAPVESNRRKPAPLQKSSDAAQLADSSTQN